MRFLPAIQNSSSANKQRALLLLLCVALGAAFMLPARAADDASCDPESVMEDAQDDPAIADALMSYTVEALVRRLRCKVPTSVMDSIREDPGSAELILSEHAPECYSKMLLVYDASTTEALEAMVEAVTESLERVLMDRGCSRAHDEAVALVESEYVHRARQIRFMDCVNQLRRLASAESLLFSQTGAYTDDFKVLAKWLAPADKASTSMQEAEAAVAASCCGAAGCEPGDDSTAWDGDWGLDMEDGDFAIYGYPISGPYCLILVTPQGVDPTSVDLCIEESQENE